LALTINLGLEPRWKRTAVACFELSQSIPPVLTTRAEIINPLHSQKALDAPDVLHALLHQELPLAMQPLGILIFHRRRPG
jgi:hypothetical protein